MIGNFNEDGNKYLPGGRRTPRGQQFEVVSFSPESFYNFRQNYERFCSPASLNSMQAEALERAATQIWALYDDVHPSDYKKDGLENHFGEWSPTHTMAIENTIATFAEYGISIAVVA